MKRYAVLLVAAVAIAACAQHGEPAQQSRYDPQTLPSGPVGASIQLGYSLVTETHRLMPGNVVARMNCAACHIDAGLRDRGGSFVGVYSRFPQWNRRSHRVITLQDRIVECFLYSMNGRPPAYASKEMIAMVSYMSWVSRGTAVLASPKAAAGFIEPLPTHLPDLAAGAHIYAATCQSCHRADGAGLGYAIPPLWGAQSFNNGAGMAHIDRMTGFVYHNMPQNAPGTLSLDQAYDVSGWVLTHRRPHFKKSALVTQTVEPAVYY